MVVLCYLKKPDKGPSRNLTRGEASAVHTQLKSSSLGLDTQHQLARMALHSLAAVELEVQHSKSACPAMLLQCAEHLEIDFYALPMLLLQE